MLKKFLHESRVDFKLVFQSREIKPLLYFYINPQNFRLVRDNIGRFMGNSVYRVDGLYVSFLLKRIWPQVFRDIKRQSFDFTSLANSFFGHVLENKKLVISYGGSENDAKIFNNVIKSRYKGINLISYHGYLSDNQIMKDIKFQSPDLIMLGLGNIRQECLGLAIIEELQIPTFTCGAFITQTARRPNDWMQYPKIINALGLRWLYRCITEPHIIVRVFKYYPIFFISLMRIK
ncbi:WecB/TagA/CpsF family glycosyltransferase [Gammaproteobacteria bacterium]|nr:WecB/TagA/CpsF family glycosyltransferase [Gammaproteobacteria bacterium]